MIKYPLSTEFFVPKNQEIPPLLFGSKVMSKSKNKMLVTFGFKGQASLQDARLDAALRTYATWLVRSARRKLADSGASEKPDNSARIDLTSEGNKRTNSL